MSSDSNVYRVLAFGDSLTEGFHFAGFRYHPCELTKKIRSIQHIQSHSFRLDATRLAELISNHCDWVYNGDPNRPNIDVRAGGKSGERVLEGMIERLRKTLDSVENESRFRWVIILGGINDLSLGAEPERIMGGLRQMYDMVYQHGANLVIMTVTESGLVKTNDPRDVKRHQLNTLIKNYAWENHFAGGKRTFCVDLDKLIPWHRPDMAEKKLLWDDHMHLTPRGYDKIAELIFQVIVDYLNLK
ncbi:unnamed protein product [Didymodactylos carnosus]|uniref:SGNH hydrolase-type esterase domain-containing protein n=2 Tax=Didymodactylos carnosus TaxID=1234261 RepID=A0A813SWZ4_9BILA|nr:unnamed protein product [Didymodactylos carnosus]CAF3585372.1 unnamed protein product [Didymodactylos carnosus]